MSSVVVEEELSVEELSVGELSSMSALSFLEHDNVVTLKMSMIIM